MSQEFKVLKNQAAINRLIYQQKIADQESRSSSAKYAGYDATVGMNKVVDVEGNIKYVQSSTTGGVGRDSQIRIRNGETFGSYDAMPRIRRIREEEQISPTIIKYYPFLQLFSGVENSIVYAYLAYDAPTRKVDSDSGYLTLPAQGIYSNGWVIKTNGNEEVFIEYIDGQIFYGLLRNKNNVQLLVEAEFTEYRTFAYKAYQYFFLGDGIWSTRAANNNPDFDINYPDYDLFGYIQVGFGAISHNIIEGGSLHEYSGEWTVVQEDATRTLTAFINTWTPLGEEEINYVFEQIEGTISTNTITGNCLGISWNRNYIIQSTNINYEVDENDFRNVETINNTTFVWNFYDESSVELNTDKFFVCPIPGDLIIGEADAVITFTINNPFGEAGWDGFSSAIDIETGISDTGVFSNLEPAWLEDYEDFALIENKLSTYINEEIIFTCKGIDDTFRFCKGNISEFTYGISIDEVKYLSITVTLTENNLSEENTYSTLHINNGSFWNFYFKFWNYFDINKEYKVLCNVVFDAPLLNSLPLSLLDYNSQYLRLASLRQSFFSVRIQATTRNLLSSLSMINKPEYKNYIYSGVYRWKIHNDGKIFPDPIDVKGDIYAIKFPSGGIEQFYGFSYNP